MSRVLINGLNVRNSPSIKSETSFAEKKDLLIVEIHKSIFTYFNQFGTRDKLLSPFIHVIFDNTLTFKSINDIIFVIDVIKCSLDKMLTFYKLFFGFI